MTKTQALAEAQRRWGKGAWVESPQTTNSCFYEVGAVQFQWMGIGDSFEEAFRQADAKANEVG